MTPAAEKAKELVDTYSDAIYGLTYATYGDSDVENVTEAAKVSATIAVDEILSEINLLHKPEYVTFYAKTDSDEWDNGYARKDFWEEVKNEIQKL